MPVYEKTLTTPNVSLFQFSPQLIAAKAIKEKAAALGADFTGPSISAVTPFDVPGVVGGFQQMFAQCTIYHSTATGTHEVHGDILRKYVILPLKGMNLGLPITDETPTPDGVGRFNHFANDGSIYWHPNTGPMALQGVVRDRWASQGWERGTLGYPVRDVFVPADGETAGDFQNGVIWIGANGIGDPLVATMPQPKLLDLVWHQFDAMVHQSPDNIGLHPDKSFDGVTDTGYGFPQSENRGLKITINGFHDGGAVLPDIDFQARMEIIFSLAFGLSNDPQTNAAVEVRDIGVVIRNIDVTDSGALTNISDAVAQKVHDAIQHASDTGITVGISIDMAAPLLSLKTMLDGSLNFYLSPTDAGKFATFVIQRDIDAM